MAYEVVMSYHLHMPSYFLGTFTEYPYSNGNAHKITEPSIIRLKFRMVLGCFSNRHIDFTCILSLSFAAW